MHVGELRAKHFSNEKQEHKDIQSNRFETHLEEGYAYIYIFPFIPISPWASPNNPIFDLGLAGRFNPAEWWKRLFHQLAFMQFCLLVQFYGNAFPPFPQPGLDCEYVKEAINTSKQTSHPSVKGFIWNGLAGFYLFICLFFTPKSVDVCWASRGVGIKSKCTFLLHVSALIVHVLSWWSLIRM